MLQLICILCGQIKGKAGIQIKCILKIWIQLDVPWEHKPLIQICNLQYSTLYIDIIKQLAIVDLNMLVLVGFLLHALMVVV